MVHGPVPYVTMLVQIQYGTEGVSHGRKQEKIFLKQSKDEEIIWKIEGITNNKITITSKLQRSITIEREVLARCHRQGKCIKLGVAQIF